MKNWENKQIDIATPNVVYDTKRQNVMRMVALKVLQQNDVDVFVNPPLIALPGRIGQPGGGGGGGAAGHGYASLGNRRYSCRPVSPTRSTSRLLDGRTSSAR